MPTSKRTQEQDSPISQSPQSTLGLQHKGNTSHNIDACVGGQRFLWKSNIEEEDNSAQEVPELQEEDLLNEDDQDGYEEDIKCSSL